MVSSYLNIRRTLDFANIKAQAPTAPKKRTSIRAKSSSTSNSGSGLIARPPPVHREGATISDSFINSKRDKRTIKSSSFLNRIEKAHKKPLKRRRPSKKLVTTLENLADALPDVEDLVKGKERDEGGKMQMRSLKSRPGARKRMEKLERMERERFSKNLAVIMAGCASGGEAAASGAVAPAVGMEVDDGVEAAPVAVAPNPAVNRFAALRAWVSANMEKHPAFEGK
ncbi:putative ATP-dependent Clp protease [Drepanopeziza brunnea f. sp. 'multigermtubi' MB_m1]|uniref:Ribosome biogenesis protein SLX9 n=1 Tax=Marssonina brunnea f. sp. multigermtubi (strain MB_m1) TaxID=1072389 RepID=K1XSG6_MARBU|nr:putative ATP-dependent Clp protease [Drepanopeziza brunnea f. sp. 'multigermtubi' MB_m1]EKD15489.1 putative ATP-dependent Clp protease [Drepanopeziza brunnea f. sp. 'multigermtubi' MB_m1]